MTDEWDEMLDDFRALGGVAENISRRRGALGWGIFPLDPSRAIAMRAPENLLIPLAHLVFEGESLKVADNSPIGLREREFFARYQAAFSWGAAGKYESAAFIRGMRALPGPIKSLLTTDFMLGYVLVGDVTRAIEDQFLATRSSRWANKRVLMPVIELVNHGPDGRYTFTDGIGVSGNFSGEVTVQYRRTDSFQMFRAWGFASSQPIAFSLPLFVKLGARMLAVRRLLEQQAINESETRLNPDMHGRFVDIRCLLLGDLGNPERPRQIFLRCLEEIGAGDGNPVFDEILAINRARFRNLAAAVGDSEDPICGMLRDICTYALAAMAEA